MKKPSAEKIKRETMIMDADQSGTIDRLEWMAYLCSSSLSSSGSGNKDYYDFELRAAFEASDADKDGIITLTELQNFLKFQVSNTLKKVPERERYMLDPEFKRCALDVFKTLTGRNLTQKTDGMTWVDMKHIKTKCESRLDELELTIDAFNVRVKTNASHKNLNVPTKGSSVLYYPTPTRQSTTSTIDTDGELQH